MQIIFAWGFCKQKSYSWCAWSNLILGSVINLRKLAVDRNWISGEYKVNFQIMSIFFFFFGKSSSLKESSWKTVYQNNNFRVILVLYRVHKKSFSSFPKQKNNNTQIGWSQIMFEIKIKHNRMNISCEKMNEKRFRRPWTIERRKKK